MDVQDLLKRLKEDVSHNRPSSASREADVAYQKPSVSSPIFSPEVKTPEPRHGDILSIKNTPGAATPVQVGANDRTNNLLNLLKFGQPVSAGATASNVPKPAQPGPDLPPLSNITQGRASPQMQETTHRATSSTSHASQDMLLRLLRRQEPPSADPDDALPTSASAAVEKPATPFKFVSPFDQLVSVPEPQADVTLEHTNGSANQADDSLSKEPHNVPESVQNIAQQVSDDAQAAIEKTAETIATILSDPLAAQPIDESAAPDNWESADLPVETHDQGVHIYNFPMKPFVSIDVKGVDMITHPARDEIVMRIASFKKEFDQVDRNLATASADLIVYATAKGGGVRVIRQDDGSNKSTFRGEDRQVFNLAISQETSTISVTPEPAQALLITGVNGSVFWTSIPTSKDGFDSAELDRRGFIFPPASSQEDPSSTAQLKTRAKLSSRHPEYFAIGRGKSIHIIWATVANTDHYLTKPSRTIDSDRYLAERCLKIATGKAGKDFTFSQDDSVIVSLDKVGRLKFWDITKFTVPEHGTSSGQRAPLEVKVPLWTLWVTAPAEKSAPTSVLFVDKERPTAKGYALRYMLVGLKQNHTIQLWDLSLGKAVQEISLPHVNENDAICSISYHAKSGIIVVGHPTRNSIFFIHLSAPRYNVPSQFSQAQYIKHLAADDDVLPRPESTAIMSGIREISLANVGELRSLDVIPPVTAAQPGEEDPLFEIYAMHSKGVTCLHIKNKDLGWSSDGRVIHPHDAEAEGKIVVATLRQPIIQETSEQASEPAKSDSKSKTSESVKATAVATHSGDDRKIKKKVLDDIVPRGETVPQTYANAAASRAAEPLKAKIETTTALLDGLAAQVRTADTKQAATDIVANHTQNLPTQNYETALNEQFMKLYDRIAEDKRIMEAAQNSKLESVLRMVSSTLTENTEKSLERLIRSAVAEQVLPSISDVVKRSLDKKIAETISLQVPQSIQKEMKTAMGSSISSALQDPNFSRSLSTQFSSKLSSRIGDDIKSAFASEMTHLKQTLNELSIKTVKEVEFQVSEKLKAYELQHKKDQEQMKAVLDQTSNIATQLTELQAQVTALQSSAETSKHAEPPAISAPAKPEDPELSAIQSLMSNPNTFEEGLVKWIQSPRQFELFEAELVNYPLSSITSVGPIVGLSVLAAISQEMGKSTAKRVGWIIAIMQASRISSPEVAEYAPRILDVVTSRLQEEYMSLSETDGSHPDLPKIAQAVRIAREHKNSLSAH